MFNEDGSPLSNEELEKVSDDRGKQYTKFVFNFLEKHGILTWDDHGRLTLFHFFEMNSCSNDELIQILAGLEGGEFDHNLKIDEYK